MRKPSITPAPMHLSVRCHARTRRGTPCQQPAVGGRKRCRMHGGAERSGGQPGNRNAWKHGRYSAENIALRRYIRDLLGSAHELVEKV
jgi:hypothetical protein